MLFLLYFRNTYTFYYEGSESTMLNCEDLINDIIKCLDEALVLIDEQTKEIEKLYDLLSQQ